MSAAAFPECTRSTGRQAQRDLIRFPQISNAKSRSGEARVHRGGFSQQTQAAARTVSPRPVSHCETQDGTDRAALVFLGRSTRVEAVSTRLYGAITPQLHALWARVQTRESCPRGGQGRTRTVIGAQGVNAPRRLVIGAHGAIWFVRNTFHLQREFTNSSNVTNQICQSIIRRVITTRQMLCF